MHSFIATYLFQQKQCPLPGLGNLSITVAPAQTDFLNKKITAPHSIISFSPLEISPGGLIQYISTQERISNNDAEQQLQNFCTGIKEAENFILPGVGKFSKTVDQIQFSPEEDMDAFLPPADAERVIHESAEHTILVGDKETTNAVMTEYFAEAPVKKDHWWIWAIVLGIIGVLTILSYYFLFNQQSA